MNDHVLNVLFLCTGNSARSIVAECILNRIGAGKFKAYSAGSHPADRVNPYAIELLKSRGYPTQDLHTKSWDAFAGPDAPPLDFVFTVCDNAAKESCPVWFGAPTTAHWGLPDPAAVEGDEAEIRAAFAEAYRILKARIDILVGLPLDSFDSLAMKRKLDEIGQSETES